MRGEPPLGLCGDCRHARTLPATGGRAYVQCRLSEADPRYPKWPRLPVLACGGYETGSGETVV